jgi:hypothetical protein
MRPPAPSNLASMRGLDIARAALTLPDPAIAPDEPHYVEIRRGGRKIRITFRRFKYKRRKTTRWHWTAESAEVIVE